MWIYYNDSLTTLKGLDNLTYIGSPVWFGSISIRGNDSLTSLKGLDNLTSAEWTVKIWDNDSLTTLEGLENLTFIGGDLMILNNVELCTSIAEALRDQVLDAGGIGGLIDIHDNKVCL